MGDQRLLAGNLGPGRSRLGAGDSQLSLDRRRAGPRDNQRRPEGVDARGEKKLRVLNCQLVLVDIFEIPWNARHVFTRMTTVALS